MGSMRAPFARLATLHSRARPGRRTGASHPKSTEWPRYPAMHSLYIHIPFCVRKCTYCDFCSYAGMDRLIPAYVAALCDEVRLRAARWRSARFDTLYVGGGTPTLLTAAQITSVLA